MPQCAPNGIHTRSPPSLFVVVIAVNVVVAKVEVAVVCTRWRTRRLPIVCAGGLSRAAFVAHISTKRLHFVVGTASACFLTTVCSPTMPSPRVCLQ